MPEAGKALVGALLSGASAMARAPFVPVLGAVVPRIAQVDGESYVSDGRAHSRALAEVGRAMSVDALTVGVDAGLDAGLDAVQRLRSICPDLALVGCPGDLAPTTLRPWCETGVEALIVKAVTGEEARLKMAGRIAAFYKMPVIVMTGDDDGAELASGCGLSGAIVMQPTSDMSGIVGGGISVALEWTLAPRNHDFFWSLAGEVPADANPEDLVTLGRAIAHEGRK